jgi:hypothetical protein
MKIDDRPVWWHKVERSLVVMLMMMVMVRTAERGESNRNQFQMFLLMLKARLNAVSVTFELQKSRSFVRMNLR